MPWKGLCRGGGNGAEEGSHDRECREYYRETADNVIRFFELAVDYVGSAGKPERDDRKRCGKHGGELRGEEAILIDSLFAENTKSV